MKKLHIQPMKFLVLLVFFSLIVAACGSQSISAISSSGGARAWLDQPWDGVSIPLAPYTLKAHARQAGGGVTAIKFKVNDIEIGNVPTDSTLALAYAETPWNPSAPGQYLIQAVALTSGGEASSELARVCVGQDATNDCGGAPLPQQGGNQAGTPLDTKIGAGPDPVYYGQCSGAEQTTFMVDVVLVSPPATPVALVKMIYTYTGPSGTSYPFSAQMVDKGGGVYSGSASVASEAQAALGGAEGTITYFIVFSDASGNLLGQSQTGTLQIKPCGAAAGAVDIKIGGSPNPVYYGNCSKGEPQVVNFEAAVADPTRVTDAVLAFRYLDSGGNPLTSDMTVAMTPMGGGVYTYAVSLPNTAPGGLAGGGTLMFTGFGYDASKNMIAKSDPGYISINSCQVPQQITTEAPPPPPVITTVVPPGPPPVIITTVAPPPPPKDTSPPMLDKVDANPTTAYYATDCGVKGSDKVTVTVYAYDDSGISTIYVWYRYLPSSGVHTVNMYAIGGDQYEAQVSVASEAYSDLGGGNGTLDMAIYAVDGAGNQGVIVAPVQPQVLYCPG